MSAAACLRRILPLHYYFQKYQLLEQSGATCLARLMVFSFVNLNESDPDLSFQALCDAWDRLRQGDTISPAAVSTASACMLPGTPVLSPLPTDSGSCPCPCPVKEQLDGDIFRLPPPHKTAGSPDEAGDGTARLCPGPWVERAEPLIRQWEATLQDQDLALFLQTHMLIQTDYPLDSATASLLFFHAKSHPWLGG